MVTTNYCSLDSGPCHDVSSPMGGKQKPASGRMKVFRKLSIRSDSSSAPSSTISDEFRDEISSLDDKNTNRVDDAHHLSPEIKFNPFESIPSWGFESPEKYTHGRTQPLESPEEFEAFHKSPSASKTKKATTHDYSSDSNRPIILVRPGALKLDQWSKVLVRKKNQFKYHSFTNEKRVRLKKNAKAMAAMQAVVEERIALEQLDHCRPEHFPSLNDAHIFHPDVGDEIKCPEGTSIGPLKPNTKLKLAVQESPKDVIPVPELAERDQPHTDDFVLPEITEMDRPHPDNFVSPETTERDRPPSEKFVLEFISAEEATVAPNKVVDKVVVALDKKRNHKQNKGSKIDEKSAKTEDETEAVYETSDYPSDGSFSTVISGDTENYPLLKAWGAKVVDCNNCGSSKAQKKLEAKKKRAEAKKKMVEDLWERKQFYWKYENVEDQRREHLENLETLVFKIAPEDENVHEDGFIEMPLGIQLSTITEGDEDLTACCSPRHSARSMGRSVSKATLNTPVDSLLDMTNQQVAATPSEDEVEGYPQQPTPQGPNNETPEGNPEQPRMSRKARRRVVSVNEIVVRTSFDDASTSDSKGGISDITEDYLHIPFSSPLYSKVLKAFREAAEENDGKDLKEEMNYLHWI